MISADDIPGFRRLADLLEVSLGEQITRPELQKMFEVCGTDTVFANNIATVKQNLKVRDEIPHSDFMRLFNVSGLLREQPLRTVRGICGRASVKPSVTVLICGATATQMYLRIKEALRQERQGTIRIERLVGLASNERLCDTLDELEDLRLLAFKSRTGRLPTEARMLHYLFDDLPVTLRHEVVPLPELQLEPQLKAFAQEVSPTDIYIPTTATTQYVALTARRVLRKVWEIGTWIKEPDLEAQVRMFARINRPRSVYVATVANKLYEALVVRRILREEWGNDFDAKGGEHRFYFSQDDIQLATTYAQLRNGQYLSPLEMFPSLAHLLREVFFLWESSQ